ncbi:MAG: 4Fe-4S double cluster binding domain-containing protein [Nitrospirota bacterium]|jgi:epoxyqueuosine reductase
MDGAREIKAHASSLGARLAGVADLAPLKAGLPTIPGGFLDPYVRAVSIALPLEDGVIEAVMERPTPEYARHYRVLNAGLDLIAAGVVRWLAGRGSLALGVPASRILDEERLMGAVSHKAVARMAGLGWQGKSLLLVTPEMGPRVRLATVLTDMPLQPDRPLANRCGDCTRCTDACPVGAIRDVPTESHYPGREDAVDLAACNARTHENARLGGVGARICGVCVRVCPHGEKKAARRPG